MSIINPGLASPDKTHLPAIALSGAAVSMWLSAFKELNDYVSAAGAANSNSTIILAEVQVETHSGPLIRVIAFVSRGGLPAQLKEVFERLGINTYEAQDLPGSAGHAEFVAEDFRSADAIPEQVADLGGPIARVMNAVSTVRACSTQCAQAFTNFIGRKGVTVQKGGYGVIDNDEVLNPDDVDELRDMYPGGSFQAIYREYLNIGFEPAVAEEPGEADQS